MALRATLTLLCAGCTFSTAGNVYRDVPPLVRAEPATHSALGEITVTSQDRSFSSSYERENLRKNLERVLRSSNLFGGDPSSALSIGVDVLDFTSPPASFGGFRSVIKVRYTLRDANGETIFETELTSSGEDDTGANLGAQRKSRAKTVSVANSLDEFRADLESFLVARAPKAAPPSQVARPLTADDELLRPIPLPADSEFDLGRYHALVIGNNDYAELPDLVTAGNDARAVTELLRSGYGFDVTLLIDATRSDILRQLARYRRALSPADNLLIYYAGHGWFDEGSGRGYWLPVDAGEDDPSNWISTADITDSLRAMAAKHVLVVADSCYSGTLTRGVAIQNRDSGYISRLATKRARVVLTSGGLEPVIDSGGGGHSVFASAFLDALRKNDGILEGTALFSAIRRPVMLNAEQTPEYGDIRMSGHAGGDFLFARPGAE